MGFLDKLKGKAARAVDQHGDKIGRGIDKAASTVDKKTGGKHGDKIHKSSAKAKEALDRLDAKNDDIGRSPSAPPPPPATPPPPPPPTSEGGRP